MKRTIVFAFCIVFMAACNDAATVKESTEKTEAPASTVQLPYTASYSSNFTDEVSDQDLLTVLNSYKHWEQGDMKALDATLADSIEFEAHNGWKYKGPKAALMERWAKSRDSLSSVAITMEAWRKHHEPVKKHDWVSVWYKEVATYKSGKMDSAYYVDDNMISNGKIAVYYQYKRAVTPNP